MLQKREFTMKNIEIALKDRFNGKKVILLGAGVSNLPLAQFLADFGATVEVRDKKTREQLGDDAVALENTGASLVLGDSYLDGMKADFVFRSPGFRHDLPSLTEAVNNGAELTMEMEMFMELCPAFTAAVTGSDGKSTTTTLIYEMLKLQYGEDRAYLGGNIGFPLLHRVHTVKPDSFVALELSSFQLMTIDTPCDVAVITNISPNHLNWHTDMQEYIDAKAKILSGAKRAVLNYGCEITRELGKKCTCPVTYFSAFPIPPEDIEEKDSLITLEGDSIIYFEKKTGKKEIIMERSDILLPGLHNVENYMTAAAALYGVVDFSNVKAVAEVFGGVKHRLELVQIKNGIYYYNSSIDSSPTRTAAAISAVTDKKINIICGGSDKNIPFEPLAEAIAAAGNVKSVTVTGQSAKKILDAIDGCASFDKEKITVQHRALFGDAVRTASSLAGEGEAVLLSPACASFDAFKNFEERGETFKNIVKNL